MDDSTTLQEQGNVDGSAAFDRRIARGANWFYWIAGLSLVNSILSVSGSDRTFLIGLGFTQVVDAIAEGFHSQTATLVGFVAAILVAALLCGTGYFARRRRWIYVVGMVLYALDGTINLVAGDWPGLAFHAFALFAMSDGVRAFAQRSQASLAASTGTFAEPIQPTGL